MWPERIRRRSTSALLAAFAAALLTLAACAPAPGASRPDEQARDASLAPVVLVPGWELGCRARADDWDRWRDAFVARGLPAEHFVVVHYDSCQPNLRTAEMVGRAVTDLRQRAGVDRVHLIAHSMGAIPARWCLARGACNGHVDQLVTLSGANHGTVWAGACFLQFWGRACADMQPGSSMLAAINADESHGGIGVETWVSACELVILPRESTFLAGAVNRDLVDVCVDHSGWKWHAPTISAVADRLSGEKRSSGVTAGT
jgi:triacylglycerol lipase